MTPLTRIYWIRVLLGAIAGLVCTAVIFLWREASPTTNLISLIGSFNTLLNGITIALLIYLVSYYILKAKYSSQVEKQSKIMSMGIFIYFFTWIIVWVLTLTIMIG